MSTLYSYIRGVQEVNKRCEHRLKTLPLGKFGIQIYYKNIGLYCTIKYLQNIISYIFSTKIKSYPKKTAT